MNSSTNDPLTLFQKGRYTLAEHQYSPNCDERPIGCVPELVVIHAISLPLGQFSESDTASYIDDLFLNQLDLSAHLDFEQLRDVHVSAHFLIRRSGKLVQFVGTDQRAWHAGVSNLMGRERCNDFSIGIELEGSDFVPFEKVQYDTLINLTGVLIQHYPISRIVGHEDIAPVRKTDPGPLFDWIYFEKKLYEIFSSKAKVWFRDDC